MVPAAASRVSVILTICTIAEGFLHATPRRRITAVRRLSGDPSDAVAHNHRWKHDPFDFSSKYGWDTFYKNGLANVDSAVNETNESDTSAAESLESLEYEWHPHISHSTVVEAIRPAITSASQNCAGNDDLPSILLVGCGNSALPRVLHDAFDSPVRVTCLDYSPVCIDMIKGMYERVCPNMDFVVGDAMNLQQVQWAGDNTDQKTFDVVVDKGLLDALMCGEGFDLERLMGGINEVLTPLEWGVHVLICFQLSKASKKGLEDLGSGYEPSLTWDFDVPVEGSEKGRACFNVGRRCSSKYANALGVDHLTTEWSED